MKPLWIAVLLLLSACNDSSSELEHRMANQPPIIELKLLESIKDNLEKSPVTFSDSCMSELDVCWYKVERSANDANLPTVKVSNADLSLTLENAVNIAVVADKRTTDDIENLNVILRGLPKGSTHEQYRHLIFNLIDQIKAAGWSHYFMPDDPRISGSQMDRIASADGVLGRYVSSHPWLDPDYQLDLKRWLQVGTFYDWYFYNNGVYLHLKAWKRNSEDAPTEKATYLISLEFLSEREFWLSGFTEEQDRLHWKQLLPARLKGYKEARLALEEKARAAGIEIDETYQDPPIKALE
ncbi:hypothetical protein [Pseudomonas sp. 6D_7.1_Bac1]|uniref:hypothetical protein n=1 Tax=Pseudomonas sp. 6D_7.1_Bac1 TaxID=2971615 RepID=UPI0021C606A8|nr:hypothetical protein [Pseudomonas sp. 6D_7.1_Bac1]MCU1747894.1 hypothetical protein [Pseudomonas sp. 6D_7.1_Bac1]